MRHFLNLLTAFVAAVMVLTNLPATAGGDHTPRFGGLVVETKAGDMEIVAKSDRLQIYFTDHGKPVKLEGAKAKVTLLNGTEKTDTELAVSGSKMEVFGSFKVAKGTKGVAVLRLSGKPPVTARFEIK